MSYKLTPNSVPSIVNDRYVVNYELNSDTDNSHVRKLEQLRHEGVNFGIDFNVNLNGQNYSANLATRSNGVRISLIDARSVLEYEHQEGQTLSGARINSGDIRNAIIDKLARAGEKELSDLENKLFGSQKRL